MFNDDEKYFLEGNGVEFKAYMKLLKELVNINSESSNLEGIKKCRDIVVREFTAAGLRDCSVELHNGRKLLVFDGAVEGSCESMEVASTINEELHSKGYEKIIFSGHLDTVQKVGNGFEKFEIREDRIYGPGVMDMKAGIVMMLNVINNIKDENLKKKIRVIITEEEEVGSNASKHKLKEFCRAAKYFLTFEPGLANGNYVVAHSGVKWLMIKVEGKAAHAGLHHKYGINAVVELCKKLTKIAELTDYSRGITLNPGVISGGSKSNVVPEYAECLVDVRFKNEEDMKYIDASVEKILSEDNFYNELIGEYSRASAETLAWLPAMPKEKSVGIAEIVKVVAKEQGLSIRSEEVGYGSDGNHVADLPLSIIDGLGPYGGGMHTTEEFMLIKSYEERLKLNEELVRQLTIEG